MEPYAGIKNDVAKLIHKNVHVLMSREICRLQRKMNKNILFFKKEKMLKNCMDKYQNNSGFL